MQFNDRVSIERVRRLGDGRVAAVARFARSGVYRYAGSEVGRPDLQTVNVYRADDEVFSEDAMTSFAHKAITLDHPSEPVSAANWRKVAVGYTEGRVARDGGFVEIPLMLADAEAVSAVESGRMKELSAGYTCELVWGDGVAPTGEAYEARQVGIRGDHIALVAAGRAGSECRVGDSAPGTTMGDADIRREVDRQHAAWDAKFEFMGGQAPPFDRTTAEFLERSKRQSASDAAVRDTVRDNRTVEQAAYDASATALNAWRGGSYAEDHAAAMATRDAIRAARYAG